MKHTRKTQQSQMCKRNSELEEMTSIDLKKKNGLIMNAANSSQYKQMNEGAFKCWRSIASYQYAIPSKAPFPLMERHFPIVLRKSNTGSLLFQKLANSCNSFANTIIT